MTVKDIYFGNEIIDSFENKFSKELNENVNKIVYSIINNFHISNHRIKVWGVDSLDDARISFVYHTGTNGKEGSIKNSLLKIYNVLDEIEKWENVEHVDVGDISIDRPDDVYDFAITIYVK
jgi:hypothetical protein